MACAKWAPTQVGLQLGEKNFKSQAHSEDFSLTQQPSKSPTFIFLGFQKDFYLFQHPAEELHLSTSGFNPKTLVPMEKGENPSCLFSSKLNPKTQVPMEKVQ